MEGLVSVQGRTLVAGNTLFGDFYRNRKVLVTGSTGFKGSWLCRILILLGAEVTGYALNPPTTPSLFNIAGIASDVDQVTGDIRDYELLKSTFKRVKPQVVLHLAAQPLVIDSYREPRYTYEANVMGTVNVLECTRACEATTSFLNVTTDKVYLNREIEGHAYQEDEKLDGFDPYSNSKSCSELVTHSYANSFFSEAAQGEAAGRCAISTARAGNVIGGGDFAENRIVPDCVRAVQTGTPLVIRNPNSMRPYEHVLEPLFAYLMIAAQQDGDHSKAGWYNIGPDEQNCVTTGELVRYFAEAWGDGFAYEARHVDGPHEANFLMLDNSKAKRVLGWMPVWDVRQAIDKTVQCSREWLDNGDEAASACMNGQIKEYLGD